MSTEPNIDSYISGFSGEVAFRLQLIRTIIAESAPQAIEKISYKMPTFYQNGNLVHFAAYEHHIGFYPAPSGISAFSAELAQYKSGKGSAQFPHDQPLPENIIRKIVAFRVEENSRSTRK